MGNISEKFKIEDLEKLNNELETVTCQVIELGHIADKLDYTDTSAIIVSFDGISRTAGMLNSICKQLLEDDYITTYDPLSDIHGKSNTSFVLLNKLCDKYSIDYPKY